MAFCRPSGVSELEQLFKDFEKGPSKRWAIKIFAGDHNGRLLARAFDFTGTQRPPPAEGVDTDRQASEVTGCWSVHQADNEMGGRLRELNYAGQLTS